MADVSESSEPRDPWAPPADVPSRPADRAPSDEHLAADAPAAGTPAEGAVPPAPPMPIPPSVANRPPEPCPPYAPRFPVPPGPSGYAGPPMNPAWPGYPPFGGWPYAAPRNSFGVTALVLGIVGAVLALTCLGAFLGLPVGIAALVFGIIGLRTVKRGEATNRGHAMAGVILGGVAVVVSGALIVLIIGSVQDGWFHQKDVRISDRGTYGASISQGEDAPHDNSRGATVPDAQRRTASSASSATCRERHDSTWSRSTPRIRSTRCSRS